MIYLTVLCAYFSSAGNTYKEYPMTYKDARSFSLQVGVSPKHPLFSKYVCRLMGAN